MICAGGYALNDVYDVETDRVNKPRRPLPAGRVGRRAAVCAAAVCWTAGLGLSLLAAPVAAAFAVVWVALLWLYSLKLKSAGVAGHLLVSMVSSSGFVLGSLLAGSVLAGLFPFCIAFVFHFAREIVKGMADSAGDSRAGIRTLPVRVGERGSRMLCAASIGAVMALSIVPFAAGAYGVYYLVPVLAIQPLLAFCIYMIVASRRSGAPAAQSYWRAARILKAAMPVGLLAFLRGGM
jgi:geranylgeranylglycerol-phosphate geranylgeranyltransferase